MSSMSVIGSGESGPSFREVQSGKPWWVMVLVLGLAALAWWAMVQQVVLGVPFGSRPAPDGAVLALWAGMGIGLPALLVSLRLVVEVDGEGVRWKLWPLARGRVSGERIVSARAVSYRPIRDYGGWGYRWVPGRAVAINLSGTEGVRVELNNGRHVLLGSERGEELARAVTAIARAPGVS